MAGSHRPECHSVCFPNRNLGVRGANGSSVCARSILTVRLRTEAYGTAFGSFKNVLCMFKIIFIVASICIREVFEKYSGSILGAYGMYGKRSGSMRLVFGAFGMKIWRCWVPYAFFGMDLEHNECFPNVSERFQYPFLILFHLCRRMYNE